MELKKGDIIKFTGSPTKCFCNKDNFKSYVISPNKVTEGVLIKHKIYNTVSIHGDFQELDLGVEYNIEVEYEGENAYGHQYKVVKCFQPRPTTTQQVVEFLGECTSLARAQAIVDVYPNIIELVEQGADIDTTNIKGVGDAVMETVRNKIKNSLMILELHKEFGQYNLSMSILKKLLSHYNNVDKAIAEINKNPYKVLTKVKGIGFAKADEIALKINPSFKSSLGRMIAYIVHSIQKTEGDGHTYVDLNVLYGDCLSQVEESCIFFEEAIQNDAFYCDRERNVIASSYTRMMEEYIVDKIVAINQNCDKWEIDIEKYSQVAGFDLTSEQMQTLTSVQEQGITCLIGGAGMGKSASIQAVVNMLEDNDKTYRLMTPTAKSADVLSDFTGRKAQTCHRHLLYDGSGFGYNEHEQLDVDVVIFDEFSMTDTWLFYNLLKAIKEQETRIILIGDSWQLPSIGCGNLLYDLSTSGVINVVELTQVFRYGDGGLMQIVTNVRNGFKFLDNNFTGTKAFGADQDFCYKEIDQEAMVSIALGYYQKLLSVGNTVDDILIVTAKNVGRYGTIVINQAVQQMIQQDQFRDSIKVSDTLILFEGDKVKQCCNNYKVKIRQQGRDDREALLSEVTPVGEVANGQTGIVTHINLEHKIIHIKVKGITYLYSLDMVKNEINLGYAITTHSAQGMGIPYIISIVPKADTFMLNNNLLYTMWTRAKKRVYVIGNIHTINGAIRKKANLNRNTFVKELLVNKKC